MLFLSKEITWKILHLPKSRSYNYLILSVKFICCLFSPVDGGGEDTFFLIGVEFKFILTYLFFFYSCSKSFINFYSLNF